NDPDPAIWIPVYGYAALVCFMAAGGRYNKWMVLAGMVIYFVYMIRFVPGLEAWFFDHDHENIAQTMKAAKPWIEETREFFGLLMLVIVFVFHYFRMRRLKPQTM
ncbi:MAG TPA: transmembrane 220 family protein, partial [Anseongella sp.]|nr:transmembrane 220 family protein [Anseongella sp.]